MTEEESAKLAEAQKRWWLPERSTERMKRMTFVKVAEAEKVVEFYKKVLEERAYQVNKWGDGDAEQLDAITDVVFEARDDKNKPNDWAAYISWSAMKWFPGGFWPFGTPKRTKKTLEEFKESMTVVASVVLSAHLWADRKLEEIDKEENE